MATTLDKNLSDVFDVEPLSASTDVTTVNEDGSIVQDLAPVATSALLNPEDEVQAERDFELARKYQIELIEKGRLALDMLLDVVQQSDAPRAFEVFSTMLGQLSAIQGDLTVLHQNRQTRKAKARNGEDGPTKVTNNNAIFVGSTAELNKMLKKMTGNS